MVCSVQDLQIGAHQLLHWSRGRQGELIHPLSSSHQVINLSGSDVERSKIMYVMYCITSNAPQQSQNLDLKGLRAPMNINGLVQVILDNFDGELRIPK